MTPTPIAQIEIDAAGRLCLTPEIGEFEHVYRAAIEVYWDKDGRFLYSPKPNKRTYIEWFVQIVAAVKGEYGCDLKVTGATQWKQIPIELKEQLLSLGVSNEDHV
ncbi:MAG: hypothetical protein Q7U98_11165 [Methylicorpusculum sp.]|uniref:hypothetical protein n=1 Tax=Methylicorpusculum sp. TaxID=2713644 RepID=UPI00271F7292|nr:hypothetical protein [Methylicorpusculum sp.]MDO8939709.1 hypothetical protein [Methylicorpusculum sp.]MDP2204607.1 hypothetical protein [Methylicorpusculum sp.]